jgi:hypothetical protein
MWILNALVGAVVGTVAYELLRPSPKSAVAQFTSNEKVYNASEAALKRAGIDYEASTDGSNSWLMVREKDRPAAVRAILAVFSK